MPWWILLSHMCRNVANAVAAQTLRARFHTSCLSELSRRVPSRGWLRFTLPLTTSPGWLHVEHSCHTTPQAIFVLLFSKGHTTDTLSCDRSALCTTFNISSKERIYENNQATHRNSLDRTNSNYCQNGENKAYMWFFMKEGVVIISFDNMLSHFKNHFCQARCFLNCHCVPFWLRSVKRVAIICCCSRQICTFSLLLNP